MHIKLEIDGQVVYESGATTAPNPAPQPPAPPSPPVGPISAEVVFLGDLARSPVDNEIWGMNAGVTYCKRQVLSGLSGWIEFKTGYLANSELPDFTHWLSANPGGQAIQSERLNGQNVGSLSVNIQALQMAGLAEVYYNIRADGPTNRYMQRNP